MKYRFNNLEAHAPECSDHDGECCLDSSGDTGTREPDADRRKDRPTECSVNPEIIREHARRLLETMQDAVLYRHKKVDAGRLRAMVMEETRDCIRDTLFLRKRKNATEWQDVMRDFSGMPPAARPSHFAAWAFVDDVLRLHFNLGLKGESNKFCCLCAGYLEDACSI